MQSASRVVLGRSTIADEVAVSPDVFVGRLRSVDSGESGEDGFRSTAAFDVSIPIKGNLAAGPSVNVRQRSGPEGGENIIVFGEFTAAMVGQEFLLFATPAAYRLRSRTAEGPVDMRSMILAPYEVRNGVSPADGVGPNIQCRQPREVVMLNRSIGVTAAILSLTSSAVLFANNASDNYTYGPLERTSQRL